MTQHYLLVKISTAANLLKKLYSDREKTGDITFIVGSERIPAHRCVLAASSAKYEAQFYGSQPDVGDIYVEDVSAAAFEEFVKFFYSGESGLTLENIEEILNLAKQCLVIQFDLKCEIFLKDSMTEGNVCWTYQLAVSYDLKTVKNACEDMIGENVPKIFTSNDFLDIDLDILLRILDIEFLKCSEFQVLDGCIKWAGAKCDQKGLNGERGENLRAELGNAVSKIRFRSMNLQDFVKFHKTHAGFFSAEEFVEIISIISGIEEITSQNFNDTVRKKIQINGTTIAEFKHVWGEDTISIGGVSYDVETRFYCISSMKEYQDKSLEELRMEDYFAKRIGLDGV